MLVYNNIIKRDGREERFDPCKIIHAIEKAAKAANMEIDYQLIQRDIIAEIEKLITIRTLNIEEIQDRVELSLMKNYPTIAKAYILYREQRRKERLK